MQIIERELTSLQKVILKLGSGSNESEALCFFMEDAEEKPRLLSEDGFIASILKSEPPLEIPFKESIDFENKYCVNGEE
ncbi:unnamed protein product [Cochlearia groenlandica]